MNLIVAVDQNWGIGKDGTMPWHIRADLQYFKEKTLGKTVLMGRKTLLSFPNQKPLPGRRNLVLSHDKSYRVEGAEVVNSIEELAAYSGDGDVFVIGGGSIYAALLPHCRYAYVTKIDASYACDTYFPNLDGMEDWNCVESGEPHDEGGVSFRFTVYQNLAVCTKQEEEPIMKDYNTDRPNLDEVNFNDLALLEEVNDDFDADVKISLLRSCSIPAFKRYGSFSAVAKVYCGSSNLGVMIYVPKENLEEARQILAAPFDTSEIEEFN